MIEELSRNIPYSAEKRAINLNVLENENKMNRKNHNRHKSHEEKKGLCKNNRSNTKYRGNKN